MLIDYTDSYHHLVIQRHRLKNYDHMVAREEYLNHKGIGKPEGKSLMHRSGDITKTVFKK